MQLSIITAIDKNRVIGFDNQLPWSLPTDLVRFKRITWGKPIVMGRHTYHSIGKPLPGRTNIILSRNTNHFAGCIVFHSLDTVLEAHKEEKEIFIIGGADLYRQTINRVDKIYLTTIHHQFKGDVFFPEFNDHDWEVIEQEDFVSDSHNPYEHTFQILKRKLKRQHSG